ncbi:MAG: RNase adapter RapZ [Mogibacterium sp.]|nr:RNase adapter RapZ [Mogibacterium sp.]
MKVVIITGLSGAGRSRTANWFEDQGYYCVDNIPPMLMKSFIEMAGKDTNPIDRIAFVADVRSRNFFNDMSEVIDELRKSDKFELRVVFLEANSNDIVRRYNEVRRNHPLTGGAASVAVIEEERAKLKDIRSRADYIVDTTNRKTSELNKELDTIINNDSGARNFVINISSFGFKHGIPMEADIMFDVRFLNNPYYVASLKKLTGNNKKIVDYVFRDPLAHKFVGSIHALLSDLITGYIDEGKYHLNVAFGCTGGHHRSVAIANAVAEVFAEDGMRVKVTHRDL